MLPAGYGMAVAGSLLFALPESVLALEMFVITYPKTRIRPSKIVWVSYVAARGVLGLGLALAPTP